MEWRFDSGTLRPPNFTHSLHGFSFRGKAGWWVLCLPFGIQACSSSCWPSTGLGLETLFWTADHGRLLFASRLGPVAAAKANSQINPTALIQFLLHTVVLAPLTIYKHIERLEPGTMLVYSRGDIAKKKYWDLSYKESAKGNTDYWAEQLRASLRRAVHSHLNDCVPEETGAYLSGGTDSSSILAFASEVQPAIKTFSIHFENPRYDEIKFCPHRRRSLSCPSLCEMFACLRRRGRYTPGSSTHFEEPFAISSAIGAYHCARLARENGVEVLLAGDGGDELFGGNERYASDKKFSLYHSVPGFLRNGLLKPLAQLLPSEGQLSLPAKYIRRAENARNPGGSFSLTHYLPHADCGTSLRTGFSGPGSPGYVVGHS